jgi:hypothetical protein
VSVRRTRLVLLLVALVAAACSSAKPTAAPVTTLPVSTTLAPVTTVTTLRPTTTSTTLRPTSTVTTLLQLGPGNASIAGTVLGPGGPVQGATVRVERLVGKLVAATDVTTSAGGSWVVPSILGGSFRVRAFKPPELGQSPVETFFLGANDRKTLDLRLPAVGGDRITATVNPSPPRVDQQATVTVQLGTGRVDDQGRPAITPRAGVLLVLSGGPGIVLDTSPQALTDGNGNAAWGIRCAAEGADTLSLTVGAGVTSFKIPACAAPGAPAGTTTTRPR